MTNFPTDLPGLKSDFDMCCIFFFMHPWHRIDKEINIASALSKIIEIKKPQVI